MAGDGLVEFEVNRGFFVLDIGLESVLQRLEARLVLEPAIERLAAERRIDADLAAMRASIDAERAAYSSDDAHDASRAFHIAMAMATRNDALMRLLDGLWIADVGESFSRAGDLPSGGRTTTSPSTSRSSRRSKRVTQHERRS